MRAGAHAEGRAVACEDAPHPADRVDQGPKDALDSPRTRTDDVVPPWAPMEEEELRHQMREAHQVGVCKDRGVAEVFDNGFSDWPGSEAQEECGRAPVYRKDVEYMETEGGEMYSLGLRTCGSVWACPVCARRVCRQKADRFRSWIESWRDQGGHVFMASLTLRHHQGQSLDLLLDAVKSAWTHLRTSKEWKRARERYGIEGYIQVTEATHGGNGWHPHKHLVFFTTQDWSDDEIRALKREIFQVWERRLVRIQDRRVEGELQYLPNDRDPSRCSTALGDPDPDRAVMISGGEKAGEYVAKLGLARELSRIDFKEGRGRNRTPFQILRDLAFYGNRRDRMLWREYVEAMHGRAHHYTSHGLRKIVGCEQVEADLQEPDREDDQRAFTIHGPLWERLYSDLGRGIDRAIRKVYRAGGWEAVVQLVEGWIDGLPPGRDVDLHVDHRNRELVDTNGVR